jgi:lipoprotein-anchoring transpeptidase ErfK/SrfK
MRPRYHLMSVSPRQPAPWTWLWGVSCLGLLALLAWIWWRHTDWAQSSRQPPASATNALSRLSPQPVLRTLPPNPRAQTSTPPEAIAPSPAPKTDPPRAGLGNDLPVELASARPVQSIFEAQLAMAREAISSGSLDGVLGSQTRAALSAYQRKHGLAPTAALDADTRARLILVPPLYATSVVSGEDLARLMPVPKTWLGKSEQTRLDHETILELLAERSFSHPNLIRRLNPGINWDNVLAGGTVIVPKAEYPPPAGRAAWVRIQLAGRVLEAFDASTNLLAHFPVSIGKLAEKRPVGALHITVTVLNPKYAFNPEVFPESEEGQQLGRKLLLPAGPNNPVGTAWMGLNRPGYGIHGTPWPELVGRTESHGCFRLANWNADYLFQLVSVGTPVLVEP